VAAPALDGARRHGPLHGSGIDERRPDHRAADPAAEFPDAASGTARMMTRRTFLGRLAGGATLLPLPAPLFSSPFMDSSPLPALPPRAVILFQGDSITDCLRDRTRSWPTDPAALGAGYAGRIAGDLLARHPGAGWQFFNRGISGDRVVDLLGRWRKDALALQPDVVSILVGVNDTWHEHTNGNGLSVARYAELYRMVLQDTRAARPQCWLVLGEPFALPGGEFKADWLPELRERGAAVRQLAQEFGAAFVPYQAMFDAAQKKYSAPELAADGVHPSPLGHQLMAAAWREAAGL
jgi:lysophospholipase L1-like esterase